MIGIKTSASGPCICMDLEYDKLLFSGGEIQIKLKPLFFVKTEYEDTPSLEFDWINYTARMSSPSDIVELFLLDDAIKNRYQPFKYRSLTLPYLPYARQDRVCDEGEALSIKVFANLINSLNFDEVKVYDAHSDVGPALINNCFNVPVEDIIQTHLSSVILGKETKKDICLISPDAGANKKVQKVSQALGGIPIIKADKIRSVKTGDITHTEVYCDDLDGKECFIVDDIADGGRTFLELAKKLKEKNAGKISLYVTHGIFSKGLGVFDGLIDEIYTTDSFNSDGNISISEKEKLHIIKL